MFCYKLTVPTPDTYYTSCIVAAESEDIARTLHPNGVHFAVNNTWISSDQSSQIALDTTTWVPANQIDKLIVTKYTPDHIFKYRGVISSVFKNKEYRRLNSSDESPGFLPPPTPPIDIPTSRRHSFYSTIVVDSPKKDIDNSLKTSIDIDSYSIEINPYYQGESPIRLENEIKFDTSDLKVEPNLTTEQKSSTPNFLTLCSIS